MCLAANAIAQPGVAHRQNDRGLIAFATEDGEILNLRIPGIELPRDGTPGHALTMQFIDAALEGVSVEIILGDEERIDRFGNLIADLDLGGQTLSAALVRSGYAMAYSWLDTREAAALLLPLEEEARQAARGLWGGRYICHPHTRPQHARLVY